MGGRGYRLWGMKIKKNINVKIQEGLYRRIKYRQDLCKMTGQPSKMDDVVGFILLVGLQTLADMDKKFSGNEGAGDPDKPRDRIGVAGLKRVE